MGKGKGSEVVTGYLEPGIYEVGPDGKRLKGNQGAIHPGVPKEYRTGNAHLKFVKRKSGKPMFKGKVTVTHKVCIGCKEDKPASEFHRRGGSWNRDGLSFGCKACNKKRNDGYERAQLRLDGKIVDGPDDFPLRDPYASEEKLSKYVCIASYYPAKGVVGVLGLPVTDEGDIAELSEGMPGWEKGRSVFVRLTTVPAEAEGRLLVGDVVCKHSGLAEDFLDVLRLRQTVHYIKPWTSYSPARFWIQDTEHRDFLTMQREAEAVRSEALESGSWAIRLSGHLLAICDPQGRLGYLVGLSRWDSSHYLYSVLGLGESGFGLFKMCVHAYMFSRASFGGDHYTRLVCRAFSLRLAVERAGGAARMLNSSREPVRRIVGFADRLVVTPRKDARSAQFFSMLRKHALLHPDLISPGLRGFLPGDFRHGVVVSIDDMPDILMFALHDLWMAASMPFTFTKVRRRGGSKVNRERRRALAVERRLAAKGGCDD